MYTDTGTLKRYLGISTTTDDVLLYEEIVRAQAVIDAHYGYAFEVSSNTSRTFDAVRDVDGVRLLLDKPLASINSVTNGDGTTVTSSQYVTEPRNNTPFWAIVIRSDASISWTYSSYPENAITVSGKWAWSTVPSYDIVQATVRLAAFFYRQKDNLLDMDRTIIAGTTTILPAAIPADVMALLRKHQRIGVG
jgi:hypothetical protein